MTKKKALEQSISHWLRNLEGVKKHITSNILVKECEIRVDDEPIFSTKWRDCALCLNYFTSECNGCPVAKKVGEGGCGNTPYEEVTGFLDSTFSFKITQAFIDLVQKEVDFLKSLREGL